MSSKRGRKRNDNLPPNRARDVQRAFRARRAAHLQALEQRVTELEEENNTLRQALNLPAANRPPLGKGPTGKDRPKSFESSSALRSASLTLRDSRDSSSSPDSTRASSLSPGTMASSLHGRNVPDIDTGPWDQSLIVGDHSDVPSSSASSSYPLPPMNAPLKAYQQHNTYPSPVAQSRNTIPSPSYPTYPHSDRLTPSSYNDSPGFNTMRDIRDEPRSHTHYNYSSQGYDHHPLPPPSQSPPLSTPPIHSTSYHSPREPSVPYPHRRSMTEPQHYSIGPGFQHLPNPAQPHHTAIRLPSPPVVNHHHLPRNVYGSDNRMNPMS